MLLQIRLKRVYEEPEPTDGMRILVERLWPRGLSRERAAVDLWLPDIAPSTALRKWYGHDPKKWPEFQRRYRAELRGNSEVVAELRRAVGRKNTTFVFASKEEKRNSATVLLAFLNR